jgi:hypothetical protein
MAAAKPIPLMAVPDYELRSRRAYLIYANVDPEASARAARELGVAYVFVGPEEVKAHTQEALAKFDRRRDLFRLAFANSRTRIYEVVPH